MSRMVEGWYIFVYEPWRKFCRWNLYPLCVSIGKLDRFGDVMWRNGALIKDLFLDMPSGRHPFWQVFFLADMQMCKGKERQSGLGH